MSLKKSFGVALCLMFGLMLIARNISAEDTENGKIISQSQDIPHFDKIILAKTGNLYVTQTDKENLTIETEDKVLPLIEVSVKDTTLTIDFKKDAKVDPNTKINYYLNIKNINSIMLAGAGSIFINDGLSTDNLKIAMNGTGLSKLKLTVKTLMTEIAGSGKVEVFGTADTQEVTISGDGEYNGSQLKGKQVTLTINGSGLAKIDASDVLNLKISGLAEVKYCGTPVINKQISGNAVVGPLNPAECRL